MKNIIYALLIASMASCTSPYKKDTGLQAVRKDGYVIKTIDSCEYIEVNLGVMDNRVYSLVHKGNCAYCVRRTNPVFVLDGKSFTVTEHEAR